MTNDEEAPVQERGENQDKPNGSKVQKILLFVLLGVIVIAGIAVGLYFGLSKGSDQNKDGTSTTNTLLEEPYTGDSVTWDYVDEETTTTNEASVTKNDIEGDEDTLIISNNNGGWWQNHCGYNPTRRNNYSPNPTGDISYRTLVNRNPDCGAYAGSYSATIEDLQQENVLHTSNFIVTTSQDNKCVFESNNIPNHDIGGETTTGKNFSSTVDANAKVFRLEIPRNPQSPPDSSSPTYVKRQGGYLTLNGILLNGVDLDMDSAFCYRKEFQGPTKVALFSQDDPTIRCGTQREWYAVPAANPSIVTLDEFSGHSFNGRYHYHGDNTALHHDHHDHSHSSGTNEGNIVEALQRTGCSGSPVVGFAPDGYPIYGHYVFGVSDGNKPTLAKARSSYRIKESFRQNGVREIQGGTETPPPIDDYHPLGMFEHDWEFVQGLGNLDECNGMVDYYGNYGYYYTTEYPYGPLCTMGVPDSSFTKPSDDYERQDGCSDSIGEDNSSGGATEGGNNNNGGGNGRPGNGSGNNNNNGVSGGNGNGRPGNDNGGNNNGGSGSRPGNGSGNNGGNGRPNNNARRC